MQVEKTKKSVNELISYLGKKMLRYTVLSEMGVCVTFLYEVLWLELFIPWGYYITINSDGYPEIRKEK